MTIREIGRRGRRIAVTVASVSATALVASLLTVSPALAASGSAPVPQWAKPVPGQSASAVAAPKSLASSQSSKPAQTPSASIASVDLSAPASKSQSVKTVHGTSQLAGTWKAFNSTGIAIAPVAENAIGSASVSLLSASETKAAGLSGLVLKLKRTDGSDKQAPLAVRLPSNLVSTAFGGDYASRVKWVEVPEADATSDRSKTAKAATPVATTPETSADVVVTPQVSAQPMLLAAQAAPVSSSGAGSFAATPLKASSSWDVSAQTGDFSWSYAMRTPPAASGPQPDLSLAYDSQSVDGDTGSTNNQPSSVGDGWSLTGGGYIERSYVSCSQDQGATGDAANSGDFCWKTDNATMSLGGHSGTLVRDSATGVWKPQQDDGSRLEHLVGTAAGCAANGTYDTDCWRLTTTDGTQYFFGLNQLPGWVSGNPTTNSTWTVPVYGNDAGEPCHAATFAASSCIQAWRWNLDYVKDVHGNAEALYYNAQTNNYLRGGTTVTSYVRGGELEHIDYGIAANAPYATNAASDKVVIGYDAYGRCSDATHVNCTSEAASGTIAAPAHPSYYPDVPFDQDCPSGACTGLVSPSFWSTSMLSTVTTKTLVSGAYATVDSWALSHSFPDPGDATNAALWLTGVTHTGWSGSTSLAEPATTFGGVTMQNRVWAFDGLAQLNRYRITTIQTSTGASVAVTYSPQECTPAQAPTIEANAANNTLRCFPQYWTPQVVPAQSPQLDLFHKYVVTAVTNDPHTGGANDAAQLTQYVYTGTPAWRYDTSPLVPEAKRTWSVYAGYNSVEVRVGSPSNPSSEETTDYAYYQGMDGDRASTSGGTKSVSVAPGVPDSLWLAGRIREQKTLNGVGGATVSDTVNSPWASAVTANDGVNTARMAEDGTVTVSEPLSTGGTRTTTTTTTYSSATGLPATIESATSDAGTSCTTNTYAATNTTAWIVGAVQEVKKVAATCAAASTAPASATISDIVTYYDGATVPATPPSAPMSAPTKADATASQQLTSSGAGVQSWVTASTTTFDSLGRPRVTTDSLGHTTTTAYTPAASGPLTGESQTNTSPYSWTSSATYNPTWGVETSATDENGKVTTATYDALGRRTAVWLPNTPQASNPTPSIAYAYTESLTAPSTVKTTTLVATQQVSTYTLYDGLGQVVQTQAAAEGSGTAITDTYYDTAGRVATANNAYWTTAVNPSTALFVPASEQQIPSDTVTQYDGAGRVTATILNSGVTEKYRTSFSYPGADRVDTTPPAGGTPTTTITDSKGERTALIQYLAATPDGAATQEKTTYGYSPAGKMTSMVDPVGNTWTWAFDLSGNQTAATDPDTGASSATFDTAGNELTTTDNRGVTLAYSYDALGRKTAERSGSSTGSLLASWVYDTIAKGQLTSSASYTGSTPSTPGLAYTSTVTGYDSQYDPAGLTVSIPTGAPAFGGTSYTTSYAYYADGALGQTTLPAMGGLNSERVRTNYDSHGKIANISGDATYAIDTWSPIGQLAQYDRSGTTSLYSTYSYDAATGMLSELKDTTAVGSVYTTQADRVYGRDNAGDVTSIASTGALGSDTQCFNYDHLQNLTEAWTPATTDCSTAPSSTTLGGPAPYWNSYTVDPATGNRTQAIEHPTTGTGTAQTDTYAYPAAGASGPHAVSSVTHTQGTNTSTSTYGYDLAGDTTSRPNQTLTYNETGKVGSLTVGSTTQSDVYDANGTLLLQTDGSTGSTLFVGPTELHQAAGASTSTAVRTYTGANGTAIAERTTAVGVTGNALSWLGTDGQNTATVAVNSSTGAITARYTDPFGGARGVTPTWTSSHGFLNAAVSALSGLVQLGARVYDSTIGKFLSADPVLDPSSPQQNNGYSYAHNNPVTSSDPSGLLVMMRDGDSPTPTKNKSAQGAAPGNGGGSPGGSSAGSGGGHSGHGDTGHGATKTKSQGVKTVAKKAKSGFDWGGFWNTVAVVAVAVVVVVAVVAVVACVVATAGICGGIAAAAAITAEGAVDVGAAVAGEAAVDAGVAAAAEGTADAAGAAVAEAGVESGSSAAESATISEQAGSGAESSASETETSLYRGVAKEHPGYDEATRGIARPRGGQASPEMHNYGDTRSEFTSWTTDRSFAEDMSHPNGVVMRVPLSSVAHQVVESPDLYDESEVLLRGLVTGAEVLP